jgi:hypothetical protein
MIADTKPFLVAVHAKRTKKKSEHKFAKYQKCSLLLFYGKSGTVKYIEERIYGRAEER